MTSSRIASLLKAAHVVVITDIDQVLECARNYNQAYEALKGLEDALLNYFNQQNMIFYKRLADDYYGNRSVLKMIEFFQQDIQDLRIEFLTFMDRYSLNANAVRIRNFPREFYLFSRKILERLSLEEESLFPILTLHDK